MTDYPETEVWLVRHGETEWSNDGRHTSSTDLPLTADGEQVARSLRGPAGGRGLRPGAHQSDATGPGDGRTWSGSTTPRSTTTWSSGRYGDYEGRTSAEIREDVPGWTIWTHPAPGGETPDQVTERLDRVVDRLRAVARAARWCSATATRCGP